MDREILLVHLAHQLLVPLPHQLLDTVPPADVGAQLDQGGHSLVGNGVGVSVVAGDLNGYGLVVVGLAGDSIHPNGLFILVVAAGTPATVLLLNAQADGAVIAYNIVAGRTLAAGLEHLAPSLGSHLADEAVDGNGVDGVVPIGRPVRRDHLYRSKRTVRETHTCCLLSTGLASILVEILLAVAGPPGLGRFALIGGALKLEQKSI